MKRVQYELLKKTEDEVNFEADYQNMFKTKSLNKKETAWTNWKSIYDPTGTISETVKQLLTADFYTLVSVYKRFMNLKVPETEMNAQGKLVRSKALKKVDTIFNYTGYYDNKIADFFTVWAEKLEIRSCYYCEMSYVNVYTIAQKNGDMIKKKRQFDLDHFLPKSKCPCVGLSLYNLVPSCQVCNSRIKKNSMPKVSVDEYEQICPTSKSADFDNNITVRLRLSSNGKSLLNERYIYLKAKRPYRQYVEFFRLSERYNYHKCEAERLKGLKARYPKSNIIKIAYLLGYREKVIEEDIFNINYLKEKGRCFEKFTRDILNSTNQKKT